MLFRRSSPLLRRAIGFLPSPFMAGGGQWGVGANIHQIAKAALSSVRSDLNAAGNQMVCTIAFAESGYGMSSSPGFVSFDGTNNWGARQGSGDCGYIEHEDSDKYGKVYVTHFAKYCTPEAGARGFFNTRAWGTAPYAARCIEAANRGDAHAVAQAMYDGGYYEGRPTKGVPVDSPKDKALRVDAYAAMIMNNVGWVSKGTGDPIYLWNEKSSGLATVGKVLLVGGLAGASYLGFTQAGRALATRLLLSARHFGAKVFG